MRHAILGAGGVGGLIGAVLARAGEDVTLIVRPERRARHPKRVSVESPFGKVSAAVTVAARLDQPADVLWVTVKATQLDAALTSIAPGTAVGAVVPLLNGIDHIEKLRERFGHDVVVPGTFAGETEKVKAGVFAHRSSFARLNLAAIGRGRLQPAVDQLTAFGFECRFVEDEVTLMWAKLVMLAPFALSTTAAAAPIGEVVADPARAARLEACTREACAVAEKGGAGVNQKKVLEALWSFPAAMRSSMQKDVDKQRPPELDAIAGPILRGGAAHGVSVPATRALVAEIEERVREPRAARRR